MKKIKIIKITDIPFGEENKITKQELMSKYNITEADFREELKRLRTENLILTDSTTGGYWRTRDINELEKMSNKFKNKKKEIEKVISLINNEMNYLGIEEKINNSFK